MEPNFQVETRHNEDAYKSMITVHYMRHKKNKYSDKLLYLVGALLAAVVWYMTAGHNYRSIRALGAGLMTLAIFWLLVPYLDRVSAQNVCRRLANTTIKSAQKNKIFGIPTRYRFYADRLDAADGEGSVETLYADITDMVETEDYFILFGKDGRCILARKSDFTVGTPEAFSAFIATACGRKLDFFEMPSRRR